MYGKGIIYVVILDLANTRAIGINIPQVFPGTDIYLSRSRYYPDVSMFHTGEF